MDEDKVRVIKISKQALYEFIYEKFVEEQEQYLGVDGLGIGNHFTIDWETGDFIFCGAVSEDENENIIPFPKDIDLKKLLKRLPYTTDSMFSPEVLYHEYTRDELAELCRDQSLTKVQEKKKTFAFKTITTTDEEICRLCERFKLGYGKKPFFVYRYDPENDIYVFVRLGIDDVLPGRVFIVWDGMLCDMDALPTERFHMTNGKPEKFFRIGSIAIPKNFNKDKDMLIDILEQAFEDFRFTINGDLYIFKIIIDRRSLKENFRFIDW